MIVPFTFRAMRLVVVLMATVVSNTVFAADDGSPQDLVTAFWRATNGEQRAASRARLLEASEDVTELYQWLKTGPHYSVDEPKGLLQQSRSGINRVNFSYAVFIPDSYDSTVPHKVEFILHGGVNRDRPQSNANYFQRTIDGAGDKSRILVIPTAWADARWWHENQAENVPAILDVLKRRYNVDENRVTLAGISDGGAGTYFFAFKQPTEWAAFLPYIGHPGVLRNTRGGSGHTLHFENLTNKPLYIVNGGADTIYPASSVAAFIEILREVRVQHTWRVIENGGHDTAWYPEERAALEQFRQDNPRDPLPDQIQWVADRTDRYNRNHWIVINQLRRPSQPAMLKVTREGNEFDVSAQGVSRFTLLLSPEEVDFSEPVTVRINGVVYSQGVVVQSRETLLKWARLDLDRTMLFTMEMSVVVPRP
jgi:predicted esterase